MVRLGVSRCCESARRHTFSLAVPDVQQFGNLLLAIRFGLIIFGDHFWPSDLVYYFWRSCFGKLLLAIRSPQSDFANQFLESWELASDFSNLRIIVWQLIPQQWHNPNFGNLFLAAKYLAIRFYRLLPIWLSELENLVTTHPSTIMQPRVARMKVRTLPARGADLLLSCQNVL